MTTGTIEVNKLTPVSTQCGDSYIGSTYSKTWSGGNGKRSEEHPYSCTIRSSNTGLIHWSQVGFPGPFTGTYPACFGGLWTPPLSLDDNDEYRLINKMREKFVGHDFNAAVNIGELKESIGMIHSTAKSLASSFIALKRGNVALALKSLGVKPKTSRVADVKHDLSVSAASAWLGLTYGWKPLIGAVGDAAEAAAAQLRPRSTRITNRVKKRIDGSYESFIPIGYSREESISLIWKVREEARYSTLQEFGFIDPSLVAWELMPYSFVVDWFYPIGNFLQARSTLNSFKGTYIRTRRSVVRLETRPGQGSVYTVLAGAYSTSAISINRTVGEISSMPLPRPTLKNPISASHVTSAISLLRVAFR